MLSRLDARILRAIQNWVADPLQWCGVSLERQIQVCYVVIVLGWLAEAYIDASKHNWFSLAIDGILIPGLLANVVYGVSEGERKRIQNFMRYEGFIWLALFLTYIAGSLFYDEPILARGTPYAQFGFFLRHYIARCTPKPPAENLKFAQETL